MCKGDLKIKFDTQIKMYAYLFKQTKKTLPDLSDEDIRNIATSIFIQNKDAILVNSKPSLSDQIKACKNNQELEALFIKHGKDIKDNKGYLAEFKAMRGKLNGQV